MKTYLAITVLACASVSACGQAEPRSAQYFDAHIEEGRQVLEGCREGTIRSAECDNAERAVKTADAKARSKRFFGTDKPRERYK